MSNDRKDVFKSPAKWVMAVGFLFFLVLSVATGGLGLILFALFVLVGWTARAIKGSQAKTENTSR